MLGLRQKEYGNLSIQIKTSKIGNMLLFSGRIHELPWQQYLDYQDKEVQEALESRIKPDLTEVVEPDGYKQNAEQSDKSVWSKIRDNEK